MAASESHLLQPPRPAALQELRTTGGEAELRHRGDGRLRPGVGGQLRHEETEGFGQE